MLDDAFQWLLGGLPWWAVLAVLFAAAAASVFYGGRLPPWASTLLAAVRAGALAALRRKPNLSWLKLRVEPQPELVSDDGRPTDLPVAKAVAGDGVTPVQMGRTEAEIEADGPGGG